jgi:hypothetical protein
MQITESASDAFADLNRRVIVTEVNAVYPTALLRSLANGKLEQVFAFQEFFKPSSLQLAGGVGVIAFSQQN